MNMTLDLTKLQMVTEGDTDIVVRRDFAHPPAKVWRVLTDPALIQKWLGSEGSRLRCDVDLRPGGSFRYEWPEFHFSGPILEVDVPKHWVYEENFSGDTSLGSLVITDLEPRGTGTRMTLTKRYPTAEARAKAIEIGMMDGYDEVFDQVEGLLTAV